MQCPVCDADNLEDAVECAGCGRMFESRRGAGEEGGPLEGLETTHFAPADLARPESLPGVEWTQIEAVPQATSEWTAGEIAIESTRYEAPAGATAASTPGAEIDRGREPTSRERTPVAAESANCPWCGEASLGAICDACGRRKSRYAGPAPAREAAVSGETVTCPSCFARVSREVRCSDCGMPFPLQEL
jgi:ssDNA-binding Zn-finger/Zn-ribbon topoisomerase 1